MKRTIALSVCLLALALGTSFAEDTKYECATDTEITPYYFGGFLFVHVKATLTDGCYSTAHNWLESWPPQLFFFACKEVVDGQACTDDIRYYEDLYRTPWPAQASKLKVHFGDGKSKEYDVIRLSENADALAEDGYGPIPLKKHAKEITSLTENGFGPVPLAQSTKFSRVATGISYNFSYDEAFKNALENLKTQGDGSTYIAHAVVLETGYQNGFIDDYLYLVLAETAPE